MDLPMRRVGHWIMVGAAVAASALLLIWLILTDQIEARLLDWVEQRSAEGYVILWSRFEVGGFPLRFVVEFSEARIAKDAASAEAPRIKAQLALWQPDRISLAMPRLDLAALDGNIGLESVTAAL